MIWKSRMLEGLIFVCFKYSLHFKCLCAGLGGPGGKWLHQLWHSCSGQSWQQCSQLLRTLCQNQRSEQKTYCEGPAGTPCTGCWVHLLISGGRRMNVQHVCISNPDILDWFCLLTFHYDRGFCTGYNATIKARKDSTMNKEGVNSGEEEEESICYLEP